MRVLAEERLLPLGITAIGAVGVGIEELPDRQAVGRLGRCDVGAGHSMCPCAASFSASATPTSSVSFGTSVKYQ